VTNEHRASSNPHRARQHDGDIRSAIAALSLPDEQLWSWYEPRPGWALQKNCVVMAEASAAGLHPILRRGAIADPAAPMDEARLFWPCGGLYLVSSGPDRTRWALWIEGNSRLADRLAKACDASPADGKFVLIDHAVLLQQNIEERFGLDPERLDEAKLRLRTALRAGAVFGWTLYEGGGKDHA